MMNRREHIAALAALAAFGTSASAARRASAPGTPFSWEWLKAEAMRVSRAPWRAPKAVEASDLDFDAVGQISYKPQRTLWTGDDAVRFFPLNRYANVPVAISIVEGGRATPFPFSPDLFDIAPDGKGHRPALLPGFSGFRVMDHTGRSDWLAFQGASYFRSAGALDQYGISARGLALNTGIEGQEEFPSFTHFWLEHRPGVVTVYALLESRSATGAYRFVNHKSDTGVTQEVTLSIRLRADIARLGIAPLTSMFWYGEGNRAQAVDWRPEIHDSDGLEIITGTGEHIWRPLVNPPRPITNSFADKAPRAFGLLQRDRHFDHYQDDGAFYHKRPNLWVEPMGDWGAGAVTLYEIPTRREYEDNIVAFWTPAAPAKAGNRYDLGYRLHWNATDPAAGPLARAVDCWTGTAGRPAAEPIAGATRLVADFEGPSLAGLGRDSGVEVVISIESGKLIESHAYPVVGLPQTWRIIADVAREGRGPTDLRVYLKRGKDALSETLLYQLH